MLAESFELQKGLAASFLLQIRAASFIQQTRPHILQGPPSYPPAYANRHSRERTPPRGRLDDYPPERSRIDSYPERSRPPLGDSYADRNRGDSYLERSRDSYPPERRDPYERSRGGLGEGYPDRRRERGRSPEWDRRDERHSRDERERSYERRDARGRAKPRLAGESIDDISMAGFEGLAWVIVIVREE
jgi:hypothetical protein